MPFGVVAWVRGRGLGPGSLVWKVRGLDSCCGWFLAEAGSAVGLEVAEVQPGAPLGVCT